MPTFASSLRLPPPVDVEGRVRLLLDCGYHALGLEPPLYSFQEEKLCGAVGRGVIQSVRLFLPYPRGLKPGEACPFRLGSLHPEEKRDALKYGSETIVFAERRSIPFVLLPAAARADDPRAALASFLSSLAKLLDLAARYAVRLALKPASGPAELPRAEEVEACFREFEGAPLVLWPEALAEPPETTQTPQKPLWERLAARLAGVTLAEREPGGLESIDWKPLRPLLEASPIWLVDPPSGAAPEHLRQSLDIMEAMARGPVRDPFV